MRRLRFLALAEKRSEETHEDDPPQGINGRRVWVVIDNSFQTHFVTIEAGESIEIHVEFPAAEWPVFMVLLPVC